MLQLKDIVLQYLHMGKQGQVKLIQWLANNNYLHVIFIKVINGKGLYLVQFNNYGKK